MKENKTYTNDSLEKTFLSLTIRNITALGNDSLRQNRDSSRLRLRLRLCRGPLSWYMSHEVESIYRGHPNTIGIRALSTVTKELEQVLENLKIRLRVENI